MGNCSKLFTGADFILTAIVGPMTDDVGVRE